MSVEYEQVKVFLRVIIMERVPGLDRWESVSREAEHPCEILLFVKVNSEYFATLMRGNLSEDKADGGFTDSDLVVPDSNSELIVHCY